MIKKPTRRIAALFFLSDLAATLAALVAAYVLRFRAEIVPVTKGVPDAGTYYRLFPLIAILWPIVYYFYGLYSVRRYRSRIEEGFGLLRDADLSRRLRTVFVSDGEAILTLILGNLEHLINHKHQLFTYLKMMGVEVGSGDLYRFRGE